jgi:hypothetical protein
VLPREQQRIVDEIAARSGVGHREYRPQLALGLINTVQNAALAASNIFAGWLNDIAGAGPHGHGLESGRQAAIV